MSQKNKESRIMASERENRSSEIDSDRKPTYALVSGILRGFGAFIIQETKRMAHLLFLKATIEKIKRYDLTTACFRLGTKAFNIGYSKELDSYHEIDLINNKIKHLQEIAQKPRETGITKTAAHLFFISKSHSQQNLLNLNRLWSIYKHGVFISEDELPLELKPYQNACRDLIVQIAKTEDRYKISKRNDGSFTLKELTGFSRYSWTTSSLAENWERWISKILPLGKSRIRIAAFGTATLALVLFVLARRHEIPQAKFDSSRSEGTRLDIVSARPYTPETAHRSSNERYAAEELRKWRSGGRDDLIKDAIRSYRSNPALSGVPESVIIKQVDDSHAHAMRMISQMGASNFRKEFGDSPEPSRRQQP